MLRRFVQKLPERFEAAEGAGSLCAVLIEMDEKTGRSRAIRRVRIEEDR